jgi:hypothetical protein
MFEGTTQDAARVGLPTRGLDGMSMGCLSFRGVCVVARPANDDLRELVDDNVASSGVVDWARGVQGKIVTGTCSGRSTVNVRLKGHSVFSNWRILSSTSLSSSARCWSPGSSTGSSILQ